MAPCGLEAGWDILHWCFTTSGQAQGRECLPLRGERVHWFLCPRGSMEPGHTAAPTLPHCGLPTHKEWTCGRRGEKVGGSKERAQKTLALGSYEADSRLHRIGVQAQHPSIQGRSEHLAGAPPPLPITPTDLGQVFFSLALDSLSEHERTRVNGPFKRCHPKTP